MKYTSLYTIVLVALSTIAFAGSYKCVQVPKTAFEKCPTPCLNQDVCKKYSWNIGECQSGTEACYSDNKGVVTVTVKAYACTLVWGQDCTCEGGTLENQYTYTSTASQPRCSSKPLTPPTAEDP